MSPRGQTMMWKLAAVTGLLALAACSADAVDTPNPSEGEPAVQGNSQTQAVDGLVITTSEDEDGTQWVHIWNDDQTELLFEMGHESPRSQYVFEHLRLGVAGQVPVEPGAPPSRELLVEQARTVFDMMGGRTGEQAYDGFGCQGGAAVFNCSLKGKCCDTHDHCYYKNDCTAQSWGCSSRSCVSPWMGGMMLAGYVLCNVGGVVLNDCENRPQDSSKSCGNCNQDVLNCILSPFSYPGQSSCCGKADSASDACGKDRPNDCEVTAGGECKPPGPKPKDPPKPPEKKPPNGSPGGETPCSKGKGCASSPPGPVDDPYGLPFSGSATTSASPEKKFGPAPDGDAVAGDIPWSYQIDFWNAAAALAPVQELVVVDYLDASFDWTTVDFGFVEYADRIVSVTEGVTTFAWRDYPTVDGCVMTGTAEGQLALDIELNFNAQTGRIELRMKVIDTATGTYPMDPYAGILPPPDEQVCGRGSLTFTVRPVASIAAGTIIRNTASVIFDTNPANNTNEVWNVIAE